MASIATSTLKPFWGRIALIESPVDEYQRPTGLIVPDRHDDDGVKRGVVVATDASPWREGEAPRMAIESLEIGGVVWYIDGTKIRDLVIVNPTDILAYEAPE